jgi:hypothetical protein
MTTNFFHPSRCCCFWIRDPGWVKIRIRDKHPGSATLILNNSLFVTLMPRKFFSLTRRDGGGGGESAGLLYFLNTLSINAFVFPAIYLLENLVCTVLSR